MELTKEQEDFLEAEGKITLCACPGSGKTYTVAKKLIRYIKTWPYTHRGVATLSFTNVAREEVLRQTTDLSVENYYQVVYPHFVGTLDSFINKFIFLRFGYLDHNKKRPQIIYGNHGILNFRSPNKICHNKGCTRNPQWFH